MIVVVKTLFWISLCVLVYAYFVYPAAMWLASRLRRHERPPQKRHDLPMLTFVIPAHNEQAVIESKIQNTLELDYPRDRLHIVVIDDASTDQTFRLANCYREQGVAVVRQETRSGKTTAINYGIEHGRGDILCLSDANVLCERAALLHLASWFADDRVGAVTADVRLQSHGGGWGRGERLYYWIERTLQKSESTVASVIGVDGGLYAIRRSLLAPLPVDTILDDFALAMRVLSQGKRILYEPEAIAFEDPPPRAVQEFRRRIRVAAGTAQSLKRGHWPSLRRPIACFNFLSHKLLRWFSPLWFVVMLLSAAVLWREGWWYWVPAVLLLAVVIVATISLVSRSLRQSWAGGLAVYFCITNAAIAVGLLKGLFNLQNAAWAPTERGVVTQSVK